MDGIGDEAIYASSVTDFVGVGIVRKGAVYVGGGGGAICGRAAIASEATGAHGMLLLCDWTKSSANGSRSRCCFGASLVH